MRLIEQIVTLKHCCQSREEELRESLGLTVSEYNCLGSFPSGETIISSELAERLHLSPSRMSRVADVLVRKGFLERTQDKLDRRVQLYTLSFLGLEIKTGIQKFFDECEENLKAHLSQADLVDIEKGMKALLEAMKDAE